MQISVAYDTTPNRITEDTYTYIQTNDFIIALVADGAGQRINASKMKRLVSKYNEEFTMARYASELTKEVIEQNIGLSPYDMLLTANSTLRERLESVYGQVTAEAMLSHEPDLLQLREDARFVRLALPVCVATAVKINIEDKSLDFAHAGDTALIIFYKDGHTVQVTEDQMAQHDLQALETALRVRDERKLPYLSDVVNDPQVVKVNRRNGIYHNYVDKNGNIDRQVGVGVINGLSELESYIQTGTLEIGDISGVIICSDGFFLPSMAQETELDRSARLQKMRELIEGDGLPAYVQYLRSIEDEDQTRNQFPRFKVHDDATAIYIEVE